MYSVFSLVIPKCLIKPRDTKKLFNIAKTLSSHLALADLKSVKPSLREVDLEFGSTVSRQFDGNLHD